MRWFLLAAAISLAGCYHAPPVMLSGATRTEWLAQRTRPQADPAETTCVASEAELVARFVARAADVARRRAESRATRAAVSVPDAPPLGLRLTNVRLNPASLSPLDRFETALRYRPERPGMIAARRDAIAREADELMAEAEDAARAARFEARVLLARARHADGSLAIAQAEAVAAESEVARIGLAKEKNVASDMALAAAEVAAADARAEVARREAERAMAQGELQARAGLASTCALPQAEPMRDEATGPTDETLVATALAEHPLIAARWAAERRVDATWAATIREAWPWLDFVEVGLDRRASIGSEATYVTVGLEIELPIFAWGGEADDAARAAAAAETEISRATVAAIEDEVRAAHAALVAAEARLRTISEPLAAARLESLREAVRGGYGDANELAKIERDVRRARRQRLDADLAVAEARARLEAALGR